MGIKSFMWDLFVGLVHYQRGWLRPVVESEDEVLLTAPRKDCSSQIAVMEENPSSLSLMLRQLLLRLQLPSNQRNHPSEVLPLFYREKSFQTQ